MASNIEFSAVERQAARNLNNSILTLYNCSERLFASAALPEEWPVSWATSKKKQTGKYKSVASASPGASGIECMLKWPV